MKVFISWSGTRSKATAELLQDWIKCVLQATRPWVSTRDIDRGALWFSEISDQLKDTSVGIVCLTNENKNKPWILFEAGALAKGLSSGRVCTFLIDLQPTDLEDPLAQFNHTLPRKDNVFALVRTLNSCLSGNALEERVLEQVFITYWPQFEEKFQLILEQFSGTEEAQPRSESNILAEILENTRYLGNRIRHLEAKGLQNRTKLTAPPQLSKTLDNDIAHTVEMLAQLGLDSDAITSYTSENYPEIPQWAIQEHINRYVNLKSHVLS